MNIDSQFSLRIAFATSDQRVLDEHLGQCQNLSIYHVTLSHSEHIETIKLTQGKGHNQQKIQDRLTALKGCFAVYCLACGNPVRQQLLRQGTRVVIHPKEALISSLIPLVQDNWPGDIADRQTRQQQKLNNDHYLNELADSQWDEY